MVTLLTPLLGLEPELELVPDDEEDAVPELVAPALLVVTVVVGLDATVLAEEVVDALRASAGSCPETSTIAIITQAATNSATAPAMTRRRI